MLLRRVLISKRMEMRVFAAAIGQAAEMALSENAGVLSGPSAKRWADSLAKTASASGLGKGVAWLVGSRIAARFIPPGPLREAFRLADSGVTQTSVAEMLSAVLGKGEKGSPEALREKALSGLWNSVPGVGVAKEVAMLDGNLLFHEPMRYVRQSRKVLDEALTALPVELGAIVLAAEALLKGEKVRTREPQGPRRD